MTRSSLFVLPLCLLSVRSVAQSNVDAVVQTERFRGQEALDQVDVNISFIGNTMVWKANERGFQQARVEALTLIEHGDSIVDYRKTSVAGPERTDTLRGDFMHQEHFLLAPGSYSLTVELRDEQSPENVTSSYKAPLVIPQRQPGASFSDLMLTVAPSASDDHAGPVPFSGTYLPSTVRTLGYYVELYGTDALLGVDSPFTVLTRLEMYETHEPKTSFSRTQRMHGAATLPLSAQFDIAKLSSGNYLLVVEARDRKGSVIAHQEQFVQRNNPISYEVGAITDADVSGTFADRISDPDTLAEFLASMRPISNNMERRIIDDRWKDKDATLMKRFMYTFWYNRNGADPEGEWKAYHEQVVIANQLYGCRNRRGYESDRGYVYLKYGKPNTIMDRSNQMDVQPYLIWHFYRAGRYSDKRFIFWHPDRASDCWELLHSEVPGEIKNPHWNQVLNESTNGPWNVSGDNRVYTIGGQRTEDEFLNPH